MRQLQSASSCQGAPRAISGVHVLDHQWVREIGGGSGCGSGCGGIGGD